MHGPGTHSFLTVCIRCNPCRAHATNVHVGFGTGGVAQVEVFGVSC
jgi:hypothetical protein